MNKLEDYNVSCSGEVKNLKTNRIISQGLSNGYKYVSLFIDNKNKKYKVHRLVAIKYIPNPNNYKYINHKDGNKLNNHKKNLEWCTSKFNMNHAFANNLIKTNKSVNQYDLSGKFIANFKSILKASYSTQTPASNISACCNHRRNQANNFKWSFA